MAEGDTPQVASKINPEGPESNSAPEAKNDAGRYAASEMRETNYSAKTARENLDQLEAEYSASGQDGKSRRFYGGGPELGQAFISLGKMNVASPRMGQEDFVVISEEVISKIPNITLEEVDDIKDYLIKASQLTGSGVVGYFDVDENDPDRALNVVLKVKKENI